MTYTDSFVHTIYTDSFVHASKLYTAGQVVHPTFSKTVNIL